MMDIDVWSRKLASGYRLYLKSGTEWSNRLPELVESLTELRTDFILDWQKTKCIGWREANQFRHKLFEGARRPEPDPRERDLKKRREELARTCERLRGPDLPGLARELRKRVDALEREIAKMEGEGS